MQELFTLAQNGNEQGISTLINQALNNKDITVQCYRYDTCLYVVLVSAEAPEPSYCIKLISNELNHLRTKLLKTVQIYGRQNNQGDHIWTQTLDLDEISDSWSSFAQTWFSKGSKQPQAKATKSTTNLSLLLLSSLSWFLLGTWGLVVKSQPNIVIDDTPNTETTVDVQNLFNEKNNSWVNSIFPDTFDLNNQPNTSAEKEQKPTFKSEKSPKQSETKPSSDEPPKLTQTTDTSAKKDDKSASKSEKPAKQSEAKPSKDKSTKKKNSHKKNKLNKKSSKSTPKVKAKSHEPSKSKTQSLTTKSDSKSSSQDTSDATLDKKASTSKQTTQPPKAAPNKLSVTPKPTTEPSKKEKSTVPATSTPASPASQTKPQTSTKENPADKSDQNQKSPDDLPAADKSSKPNSSWTSPTEEKSDKNLEPKPSVPSNTPKADTTPTPQTTSQPWLPEKQPEKDAVNDAPKSQPTKTPSPKQKQDTTSPANSKPGSISKPQVSKNDGYITIKAVGDIVPGTNFPNNRLPDKNKIFKKVKKSLDGADILFGNFESTFTNSSRVGKDTSRPMVFAFRTPPTFVNVFKKTGFDVLSVANNHSLDFSQVGFTDTMKTIANAGMKPVGKKNEIVYKKVKDIPIAFIGFSSLDVHNSLNDLEAAKALVLEAKQNAKIVVISVHGGAEGTDAIRVKNKQENFHGENRGNMVLFSRTLIDNGADLVLGHGPHVVRAMELYKGKMIAYSLGNFVGYRTLSTAGDLAKSLVLQVKLNSKGNFVSGKIIPVMLDRQGLPYPDKQLNSVKLISKLTKSDFPNTDLAINRKGEIHKRFRTYRFFTLKF
ncbi:Capsule synthesis protein, CapA [Crinalium epipsammum PCC 9333]|uniref:Capsule synthesis protein, CapA n=1 Tax=Crinalium epipsammum PCC 9333 TaxID=1173022 RepID=K9W4V6_9CYAN|nr:CapA family protein [Crinalium epipsammum]AFZ14777.1 Capsule synthesis protein, CapA [Crinalium epipsammum PCC 9333]